MNGRSCNISSRASQFGGFKSHRVHSSHDWLIFNQPKLSSPLSQQTSSSSFSCESAWLPEFTNDFGEVRLKRVRGKLNLNQRLDREKCIRLYQKWVLDDNYMVLKKIDSRERNVEYRAVKARKRGNDVDTYRISQQLCAMREPILAYIRRGERLQSTCAVYVTGTIDPRLVEYDREYAWQYLGYWFNMFLAYLRKHCQGARIHVFRSWEAHKTGWPHFHAILCFEGFSWSIFQDSQSKWRVDDKDVFENAWGYGFIDVRALTTGTADRSIERVVWYVSKYVGKSATDADYRHVESWSIKRLLTESILWYYGKRSYSVSRDLARASDSEVDLKRRKSTIQTNLEGDLVSDREIVWEFVGLVRRKDTKLGRDDWVKVYSGPPDWLDLCWKPYSCRVGLGWTSTWGN